MSKKLITTSCILLIILLSATFFLRIVNLSDLFHFTYDEEIIAFVGKRMWVNHHIPFIGGVTPMHVHLAPYFYWFSGILLGLSALNPLGWGVWAAFLAVGTVFLLYKTGSLFFGKKTAVIASIFYIFSFYQNMFDRHYWGLAFNGLLTLLVFFSLHKISTGKGRYLYLLAAVLAFAFHTDPSTLILFILSFFILVIYKKLVWKKIILASCIFAISFLPLIIFDLRHDFSNSKGILIYIEELKTKKSGVLDQNTFDILFFVPQVLGRTLYMTGDTNLAKLYSYCPQHAVSRVQAVPNFILALVIVIYALAIFFFLSEKNHHKKISLHLILLLSFSAYLGIVTYGLFFGGDVFDHYLSTLFPAFYLLVSYVLVRIFRNKWIIFVLLTIFIVSNLFLLQNVKHRFGFSDKEKAVKWAIEKTGNESFSLDVLSSCFRYNGYRYLFYLFGKEPAKSYVDANFTHLFDTPPSQEHPRLLIVIANPDFLETSSYRDEYNSLETQLIEKASFGNTEVLLIDNSNQRFVGKY